MVEFAGFLWLYSVIGLVTYLAAVWDHKNTNRFERFHEGLLRLNVLAEVGGVKSREFWIFLLVLFLLFGPLVTVYLGVPMFVRQYLYYLNSRNSDEHEDNAV